MRAERNRPTAAPSVHHQAVSGRLERELRRILEDAVEVWRFGGSGSEEETTHERFTDRLPVRVRGERVGEIELDDVFSQPT